MEIQKKKKTIWIANQTQGPFYVHGGMIDFHNTFAPVVNWSTVKLIIMMAEMDG